MTQRRIPQLDGLRGIAALLVAIFHLLRPAFNSGWLGVDIFFVLSGFLITSLLLREFDKHQSINLKQFYLRRALRLMPVATCFTLVICAAHLALGKSLKTVLVSFSAVQLYWMNWAQAFRLHINYVGLEQTWSLSIEEHFYFIWPLALTYFLRKRLSLRQWLCVGIVAVMFWRAFLFWNGATAERLYAGTDTRADALLVGCLCATLSREGLRVSAFSASLAMLGLVAMIGSNAHLVPFYFLGGFTLFAACSGICILWLAQTDEGWSRRLLATAPLVWVGHISYSLYLWHHPVYLAVGRIGWNPPYKLLALALSFVVAALSYYCIEQPFLRLRKSFH